MAGPHQAVASGGDGACGSVLLEMALIGVLRIGGSRASTRPRWGMTSGALEWVKQWHALQSSTSRRGDWLVGERKWTTVQWGKWS
jgi:hypothetical protein